MSVKQLSTVTMSDLGDKPGVPEPITMSVLPSGIQPKIELSSDGPLQKVQLIATSTMPDPKDPRAPKFKGKHVHAFVQSLEHLAIACGMSDAELPGYVLRYCSREVRNVLINEEVFRGTAWPPTKERLIYLYESQTSQFKASVRKLRKFVRKQAKKKRVRNRKTLDEYRNKFVQHLGNLVKKKEFAENEANVMFYQGLPAKLREAILPMLREEGKALGTTVSKSCPPPIESVLNAARDYYSSDDINRLDSDDDDDDSDDSSSSDDETDSDGSSSDSDTNDADLFKDRKKKRCGKKKSKKYSSDSDDSGSDSDTDRKRKKKAKSRRGGKDKLATLEERIAKRMDDLAIRLMMDRQLSPPAPIPSLTNVYGGAPPPQSFTAAASAMGWSGDKKCFVCGKVEGMGLDHRFGVRSCPETGKLTNEGLLAYSPADGRMLRPDGRELPRLQTLPNGLAAYLRAEAQLQSQPSGSAWPSRDPPPHQSLTGIRECMSLGLYRDDCPVFEHDESSLSSFAGAYAMPAVTRSKGKEVERMAQIEEVQEDGAARQVPAIPSSASPEKMPRLGTTGREAPTPAYRPHLANTEEGWKASLKDRFKTRVEDLADERDTNRSDPSHLRMSSKTTPVRFTSDVQESVSLDAIQDRILNTVLTISLRDVLAMSPHLQKRLGSLVKTRREYEPRAVKAAEICEMTCLEADVENDVRANDASGSAHVSYDQASEDINELLERYADAVALKRSRLFAMTSGLVSVVFGSQRATFLVDTGSELNLVSRQLWEVSNLDVDKDGARWSLKGLGGENVPLIGCCRDAPLQLGGKIFDHHFFVCESDRGRYDGILGQPWFEWYAANIQYNRNGAVMLQAFTTGDKEGASAHVPIVKAEHPRNSDRLVLTSQASTTMSFL